jgi:hypothetical protein
LCAADDVLQKEKYCGVSLRFIFSSLRFVDVKVKYTNFLENLFLISVNFVRKLMSGLKEEE